jgi:peptidoglycan/LPS O-acetylase OafA/YrhL
VPAYYVALFLIVLLFNRQYFQVSHWHDLWLFLTFRQDFPATYQTISGPFWTLAVEFQFYLLLPLIAWIIRFIVQRGKVNWRLARLAFCLFIMIAWGLFSLYWGGYFWRKGITLVPFIPNSILNTVMLYIYGGSGKSLEVFAVGMLLCTLYVFLQNTPEAKPWNERLHASSVLFFLIGMAILGFMTLWHFYTWYYNYALHFLDPYRNLLVNSWNEWQGIFYAIGFGFCILALLKGPAWLKRPFEWMPLRCIGWISFSFYMWHDPLIEFFTTTVLTSLHQSVHPTSLLIGLLWVWVLIVVIPISLASYLWIEKPGMRLGEKLQRKLIKPRQATSSASQQGKPLSAL